MADRATKRAARQLAHHFSTLLSRSCYELAALRLAHGADNGKLQLLQDSPAARQVFAGVVLEAVAMFESASSEPAP
jgi:predicted Kef-type K+ transport protein